MVPRPRPRLGGRLAAAVALMKAIDCPCREETLSSDGSCDFLAFGYPWCVRCREHHRPWPACPGIAGTVVPQPMLVLPPVSSSD